MARPVEFGLKHSGVFSLRNSIRIAADAAFVERDVTGPLDLVFALEGSWEGVAVRVAQSDDEVVVGILSNPSGALIKQIGERLERMLSLDIDGAGFDAVGERDPVIGALQKRCPGLRPILFPSPYEAAARAIIGHRVPVRRAAALALRLAQEIGIALAAGDRIAYAFPAPAKLATMRPLQGLSERKVEQLRALGRATVDGWLSSDRLRSMSAEQSASHLQQLAGIGPFSAELIRIRGVGDVDAFPVTEMRLQRAMASAYELGDTPDLATLERIAGGWRPYRSWAGLLMRNSDALSMTA